MDHYPGDTHTGVTGAATIVASRPRSVMAKHIASQVPWFLYIIIGFVLVKLVVENIREPIFTVGPYVLTWVEILYISAALAAMAELHRVSKPGVDNTWEAIAMAAIAIVQIVVFALGAANVIELQIFHNTEFLVITIISTLQGGLAIKVNARTLKRTIDYGGGHG